MKRRETYFMAVALTMASISCGYHLGSGPVTTPGNIKTVAVPVFENFTTEPELGSLLASATRREITRRDMIAVAPANKADAILRGAAMKIDMEPLSFDGSGFTTAYRVRLKVNVALIRGDEILWRADNIEKDEQILVGELPADNIARRAFALERISDDMAEYIHTMMAEGF